MVCCTNSLSGIEKSHNECFSGIALCVTYVFQMMLLCYYDNNKGLKVFLSANLREPAREGMWEVWWYIILK